MPLPRLDLRARRLIGAPSTADIENFDKADWPLHQVAVATWEGYLFLNLSEDPEPFEQAFEPLLGRFSRFNMPNLKVYRTIEYDVSTATGSSSSRTTPSAITAGRCIPLAKLTPPTSGENDLTQRARSPAGSW